MIRPKPFLKKCPKCGKMFLCTPKSDCLNPSDFFCDKCSGKKDTNLISKIISVIKKV